jgi:hypothetical protein
MDENTHTLVQDTVVSAYTGGENYQGGTAAALKPMPG